MADGGLTEIQLIAQYCCNGITSTLDCPFNPNVQRKCIDAQANTIMFDGSSKKVGSLEIGDRVATLDQNGQLASTEVIMMMDISQEECKFRLRNYCYTFLLKVLFISQLFKHNNQIK